MNNDIIIQKHFQYTSCDQMKNYRCFFNLYNFKRGEKKNSNKKNHPIITYTLHHKIDELFNLSI